MTDARCAECDCTDGNCSWIVSADEQTASAHEAGRKAGLEQAAQVAESCVAPDAHPNSIAAFMAKDIAAAIRAMMD